MTKYFKNISLRLFFILIAALLLLSAAALFNDSPSIRAFIALSLIALSTLAWWLARSINRIINYAEAMAANRPAQAPLFGDNYLYRLVSAIHHLRDELNHKQQIENYVLGLTHELKTPLTAQQAALELLKDSDLNSEQQALLQRLERSGHKQQQLIQRLLQLARLENRQHLDKRQTLNLYPLIQQAAADCSAALKEKNLQIQIPESQNLALTGDSLLLRQALDNLLYNAIDFAAVQSRIVINIERQNSALRLSVSNTGQPIPDYALAKIPQRFYSLPRENGQKSSGLGLSFVQEIMRLHQGSLQLSNTADGVCVSLCLPISGEYPALTVK